MDCTWKRAHKRAWAADLLGMSPLLHSHKHITSCQTRLYQSKTMMHHDNINISFLWPHINSRPLHIQGGLKDFHHHNRDNHDWRSTSHVWSHATLSVHNPNLHYWTHGGTKAMFLGPQLQHDHWPRIHETPQPGHERLWQHHILGWGANFHGPSWLLDYRCIMQQKSCLNKQPQTSNDNDTMIGEETFTSEALNLVRYIKADLELIAQGCTEPTTEQQSKLLLILQEHETLFLGKWGNLWQSKLQKVQRPSGPSHTQYHWRTT